MRKPSRTASVSRTLGGLALAAFLCAAGLRGEPSPWVGNYGVLLGEGSAGALAAVDCVSPTALALQDPENLWILDQAGRRLRRVDTLGRRLRPVPAPVSRALAGSPAQWLAWDSGRKHLLLGAGTALLIWDGTALNRASLPFPVRALAPLSRSAMAQDMEGGFHRIPWDGRGPAGSARGLGAGLGLAAAEGSVLAVSVSHTAVLSHVQLDPDGNSLAGNLSVRPVDGSEKLAHVPMAAATFWPQDERGYLAVGRDIWYFEAGLPGFWRMSVPNRLDEEAELKGARGVLRPWGPVAALAADPGHRLVFLSDPAHGRVFWVKDQDFDRRRFGEGSRDFSDGFAHGRQPLPGVRRLLFYGSSYSFFSVEGPGHHRGLAHRTEHFLNQPAWGGRPGLFEVLFGGSMLRGAGYELDVFYLAASRMRRHAERYRPDALVFVVNPMDLFYALASHVARAPDGDGYALGAFDPEFMLDDERASRYQGLALELYRDIVARPDFYGEDLGLHEDGALKYDVFKSDIYRLYEDPVFGAMIERAGLRLLRDVAAAAKESLPGKPRYLVFAENRNFMGETENSGQDRFYGLPVKRFYSGERFLKGARDQGFKTLDLRPGQHQGQLGYYPLFLANDHLSPGGVELTAQLLAEALLVQRDLKGAPVSARGGLEAGASGGTR